MMRWLISFWLIFFEELLCVCGNQNTILLGFFFIQEDVFKRLIEYKYNVHLVAIDLR